MMSTNIIVMLSMLFTLGPVGFALNIAMIFLTIFKIGTKKDYSMALLSLAVINGAGSIIAGVLQPIALLVDVNPKSIYCQFVGLLFFALGFCEAFVQPILSLGRYVALAHPQTHLRIFNPRMVKIYIATSVICGTMFPVIFYCMGTEFGRVNDTICMIDITMVSYWHILVVMGLQMSSNSISMFCTYKLIILLKKHRTNANQLQVRSQIHETREIIILVVVELMLPMLLETPGMIMCVIMRYSEVDSVVFAIFLGIFVCHSLTYPIVVVCVIKPYRNAVKPTINKLLTTKSKSIVNNRVSIIVTASTL